MIKPKSLLAPGGAGSPSTTSPLTSRTARSPARPGTPSRRAAPASPPSARRAANCPLRARCTTCKTGRKLILHPRDGLLRAARADWGATGLRKDYTAWRPNVERAVAQVATFRAAAKLRYRGVTKNHAWLKRRTAALNLRNLIGKGLTRRGGAWALAA